MVRWVCSARIADRCHTKDLKTCLELLGSQMFVEAVDWFGYLERMDVDSWPRKVLDYEINGKCPHGPPKKRWRDCIQEDLSALKLRPTMAQDREMWRQAIHPQE